MDISANRRVVHNSATHCKARF